MNNRMEKADSKIIEVILKAINSLNDPRLHKELITVTETKTSSDFTNCKVKVSIYSEDENLKKTTMQILKTSSGYIKKQLAQNLDMRNIPNLVFILDDGAEYSEKINKILKELNIPKEEDENY